MFMEETTPVQKYTEPAGSEEMDEETSSFLEGFHSGDDPQVCEECESAIREKSCLRKIEGENHMFCSEVCADDFEESV